MQTYSHKISSAKCNHKWYNFLVNTVSIQEESKLICAKWIYFDYF